MTSPVDTSVKHFTSDMPGAPVLNGTAGSLIALLDACLVTGFGQQTATSVVVAGGVATVTLPLTFPAKTDMVILLAGASGGWAPLNGEQRVVGVGSGNTVRFETALADGTAPGAITVRMAPAGWSKVFTKTNVAVFKSLDVAAHGGGMYLRVDDTNAQFARVVGYESMTDVDTGVGPFPTSAQMAGGGYWPKSNVASAAAVTWNFAADSRLFFIADQPGVVSNAGWQIGNVRVFGDALPLRPSGDAFAVVLNYSVNAAVTNMFDGCISTTMTARIASPRSYTGLGSSVLQDLLTWGMTQPSTFSGVTNIQGPFPSPVDGALYLSRKIVTIGAAAYTPRAELPGLHHLHQTGVWDSIRGGDKVVGTGVLAGRNLLAMQGAANAGFNAASSSSNTTIVLVDTTGPWR